MRSAPNPSSALTALWTRLTEAPAALPEIDRHPARLLSALQLVILLLGMLALPLLALGAFPFPQNLIQSWIRVAAAATAGILLSYLIGRGGGFRLSAILTIGLILAATVAAALLDPAGLSPGYLVLAGLLSSLFLPTQATLVVFGLTAAIVVLLPTWVPSLTGPDPFGVFFHLLVISVLVIIASRVREQYLDRIRAQSESLTEHGARLEETTRAVEAANQELHHSLRDIERLQGESETLAEWSDMLQSCSAPDDAFPVVAHYAPRLFPGGGGALYIYSPSRNDLELRARWGEGGETGYPTNFEPDQCWALRRGRLHTLGGDHPGPACGHLSPAEGESYLCAPLAAQGETLGVMVLHTPQGGKSPPDEPRQPRLALEAAGRISVALANLRLRETLRYQSVRDPMTNLFNRRVMEEMLTREIRRSERSGRPFSVILLDLDHFKIFNDRFGHPAGDLLLQQVARVLLNRIRGSDVACRYGGEEFVLMLVEAGPEIAVTRAEELRQEIGALQTEYLGARLGPVTCSGGVASYPADGLSPELLLRAADMALYQAKDSGRNRVVHLGPAGRPT